MKITVLSLLVFAMVAGGCRQAVSEPESVFLRSAAIREAAYDRSAQTLCVVFANGSRYVYAAVPEQTFTALKAASSPGRYFHTQIKPRYTVMRVEPNQSHDIRARQRN